MQKTPEMWVRSLGWEGPLQEEMATRFGILAWEIPWREEPGRPWGCKNRTRLSTRANVFIL